ncbi:MAG: enolase C-terminal domain-like protein, partial [Candidatus Halalkalibacterium sp. M3_1C_030]
MDLNAYTYSFPFKKSFQTSSKTFEERKGLVLELKEQEITALGEAAPLPGFSRESLQDVVDQLKANSDKIKDLFINELSLEALQVFHRKNEIYPSIQFAMDTLAVDYLSQKNKTSAQDYLFDEYSKNLKTNGIIPISGKEKPLDLVRKLSEEGYETIKIKIGKDFQSEHQQLKKIRSSFPKMTIRLDVNKAWETEEAIENLS